MGWLHDDITNEDFLFIGNFVAYRTRMDWYVAGFTDYVTTRQMGPSAKRFTPCTDYGCHYCSVCVRNLGYPDFLGELIGRYHGRDKP